MFITKSSLLLKKFIITRSLLQKAGAKEKNLQQTPERNLQAARKKARVKEKNLSEIYKK